MVAPGFQNRSGAPAERELLVIPITSRLATVINPLPNVVLKRGDIIHDVYVRIRAAETSATTKTIDVGILSAGADLDADGLIDGLSTATLGVIPGGVVVTVGGTETFLASTTYGVQMIDFLAGANVAGDVGTMVRKPKVIAVDDATISYQLGSAHTQIVGEIFVVISRLPL